MKEQKERAVIVTTAHKGVFFGYATETGGSTINLRAARMCVYWSADLGGRGKPVKSGDIQEVAGPLVLCGPRALHATLNPDKWKGERLWLVALHGEVQHADDKVGALKREILCEVKR
jgi:hypothetical protein